jgi:phage terminase large subunit-like protein
MATLEQGIKPAVVRKKSAEIKRERRKKRPSARRIDAAQAQLDAMRSVAATEAPRSAVL